MNEEIKENIRKLTDVIMAITIAVLLYILFKFISENTTTTEILKEIPVSNNLIRYWSIALAVFIVAYFLNSYARGLLKELNKEWKSYGFSAIATLIEVVSTTLILIIFFQKGLYSNFMVLFIVTTLVLFYVAEQIRNTPKNNVKAKRAKK